MSLNAKDSLGRRGEQRDRPTGGVGRRGPLVETAEGARLADQAGAAAAFRRLVELRELGERLLVEMPLQQRLRLRQRIAARGRVDGGRSRSEQEKAESDQGGNQDR